MTGLGVLGIVAGSRLQSVVGSAVEKLTPTGTGLVSLIPGADRFRIYTVTGNIPSIPAQTFKLTVDGLVNRPSQLSYEDLLGMPQTKLIKPFQCVTGWRVPAVPWTGVTLASVLDAAGVSPGATGVEFYSADGIYTESLSLDQARRSDVLLAHTMYNRPLSAEHGGPVRLYVAPMYGYKSIKWLNRISVVARTTPGFWELEGYAVNAWIGRSNGRSDPPVD
jgi:DMSO/TMAO reductase YedYZ molybdopterin-dependent catalytic subunit